MLATGTSSTTDGIITTPNGRSKGGRAARVGTLNKYLTDAGFGDRVQREPEISAADEFTDPPDTDFEPKGKPEDIAAAAAIPANNNDGSSPEWFDIQKQWVYLGHQKRFLDLASREMWEIEAFDKFFSYVRVSDKDGKTPLSTHILRNRLLPTYRSAVFEPGNSAPPKTGGNFNMWMPSDIVPKEGDSTLFDDHMEYLFADPVARGHVLDYLAWNYCNQNLKPRHWLLVHGEIQGTGKSFIAHVMRRLLGKKLSSGVYSNSRLLRGKNLTANHNGWELSTKLLVIEEVRPGFGSSAAVENMVHDLVSEDTLEVDMKNISPIQIANYLMGLLFSNKADALTFDNSDRRFEIESVDTPTRKLAVKPPAYYDKLYALLDDPVAMAAIAWQFTKRDLKGYSGLNNAPLTAAKVAMAEQTRDELSIWFDEHRSGPLLTRSLVTLDEVLAEIPKDIDRHARNIRKRVIALMREKLNGEDIGRVRLGGRKAPQISMWRINKETTEPTDRYAYPDKRLSLIYRRERGQLTPQEKREEAGREALRLEEARIEFAEAELVPEPVVDDIEAMM